MNVVRKIVDLLDRRERRRAGLLVPIVIAMAFAEVAGIASIAPFLTLMSDPNAIETNQLLGWIYRTFGFESDRSFLIFTGSLVVFVLLAANALLTAGYWILFRFGAMRNHSISRRLLIRYLQQPYSFFLQRNSAALANNILQEVQQIVNGIVIPGLLLIARSVATIAIVVLLIVLDPLLALLTTVLLGGAYGVILLVSRRYLLRIGRERVKANQARYQTAGEAMGGLKELRILGRESEMVRRYTTPSEQFARFQAGARILGNVPRYALEAVAFGSVVGIVVLMLAGGRDVSDVIPVLGLYAFAGYRLMPALNQIFQGVTNIRFNLGALDEVHAMVAKVDATHADPDAFPSTSADTLLPFEDGLRFRDVSFRYEDGPTVLHDLSFTVPKNASVAFAGTTGAGKTTVIDLLLGLLPPTSGTITIDGVALDEATAPAWQGRVGYVPQTIFLTDDTVARNIALGLPDEVIDDDALERAARMARVHEFISEELVDGYGTVVGERGVRLSGGQRQRIGIARALYHDPDVLVFDEATSALDGTTEEAVFEAIEALTGRKTIVTIAHRLTTIRSADTIFFLDQGRIVARGRYDELIVENSDFRRMAGVAEPTA